MRGNIIFPPLPLSLKYFSYYWSLATFVNRFFIYSGDSSYYKK